MDTRYLGSSLVALDKNGVDRRRIWTAAKEDAYYQAHRPGKQRRIPRIGFAVVGVAIGIMTLGLWHS